VKTKLCVLAGVTVVVWCMKHYYAGARADDLWWILRPTASLAGLMTGATFTFSPGEGYFSRADLFMIEKSCAGINFMIAAFVTLVFARFHRIGSAISSAGVVGIALLASYSAAVLVNAVRIAIAMWIGAHPIALRAFTAAEVHRIEGILVYFGGLVMLYELARARA
jgi:exosortase K